MNSNINHQPTSKALSPLSDKQNILWNTLGCIFYLGCQWLTTVLVVTLSLDYSNSGSYAFAMSAGTVFTAISLYKVRTFQVSDLQNHYSSSNYIAFRFITMAIGFLCAISYSACISISFLPVVCSYLMFKADEALSDVFYGIYQINSRMDYIGKSQIARGVLSFCSFAIIMYCSHDLCLSTLGMWISCLLVTVFYDLQKTRLFGTIKPLISRQMALRLAKVCFPAVLASVITTLIVSIPRQIFGASFGEPALGVYAAIATPAIIVQAACLYIYMPLIGKISGYWINGNKRPLALLIVAVVVIILAVSLLFTILLNLVSVPLYGTVYGPDILDSLYLLTPALLTTGCISLVLFLTDVLVIFRHIWLSAVACFIGLLITVFSMQQFMDSFYMNGISFSVIAGCVVAIAFELLFVAKCLSKK